MTYELKDFVTDAQLKRYTELITGLRKSTVNDTYSDRYGIDNLIGTPFCFVKQNGVILYSSNTDDIYDNWLNCLEWAVKNETN